MNLETIVESSLLSFDSPLNSAQSTDKVLSKSGFNLRTGKYTPAVLNLGNSFVKEDSDYTRNLSPVSSARPLDLAHMELSRSLGSFDFSGSGDSSPSQFTPLNKSPSQFNPNKSPSQFTRADSSPIQFSPVFSGEHGHSPKTLSPRTPASLTSQTQRTPLSVRSRSAHNLTPKNLCTGSIPEGKIFTPTLSEKSTTSSASRSRPRTPKSIKSHVSSHDIKVPEDDRKIPRSLSKNLSDDGNTDFTSPAFQGKLSRRGSLTSKMSKATKMSTTSSHHGHRRKRERHHSPRHSHHSKPREDKPRAFWEIFFSGCI